MKDKYGFERMRIDNVTVENVIVIHTAEGEGTEKDLLKVVNRYYDMNGNYLFTKDPTE